MEKLERNGTHHAEARAATAGGGLAPDRERRSPDMFEELVVLDSAAVYRSLKNFYSARNPRRRARLEPTEDGILIRSAPDFGFGTTGERDRG